MFIFKCWKFCGITHLGIIALSSVESYVRSLSRPDLLDLLVQPASEDVNMEEVEDLRPSKRKIIYTEVLPLSMCAFMRFNVVISSMTQMWFLPVFSLFSFPA